jgi:hypothetical protein
VSAVSELKYNSAVVLKARQEGKTIFGSAVADDLLQEIAYLRAKVEAAEKEHFKRIECERNLQESQAIINCYEMSIRKLETDRDNLQAQVGVLRETLGLVVADINMAQNPTCDSAAWLDLALSKINQVISITPGCPADECPDGDTCRRCWGKYLLGMLAK